MHPDRRRRGRAIRKQRRDERRNGTGTLTVRISVDTTSFEVGLLLDRLASVTAAAVGAMTAVRGFKNSINRLMHLEYWEARVRAIALSYNMPVTIERLDMSTVSITAPASAPEDLRDHLLSFAAELNDEGITTTLDFIRTCLGCGCTDEQACFLGCWWITPGANICSNCDSPENRARVDELTAQRERRSAIRALDAEITTTKGGK